MSQAETILTWPIPIYTPEQGTKGKTFFNFLKIIETKQGAESLGTIEGR